VRNVVTTTRLARFAWFTLSYIVAVVLFGAVVRATDSGAGCGSNWPTCQGDVVPLEGSAETAIEFTHRTTSFLAVVFVVVLAVWVLRVRPKGDVVRLTAISSGVLILSEALIGAALVLFGWTEDDASTGRAISIAVHLVNTFLLLASLALTAWWLGEGTRPARPLPRGRLRLMTIGAGALVITGAFGAITALGDTLLPDERLTEGFGPDWTGTFLVRLRWIHPIVAVAAAVLVVWMVRTIRVRGRGVALARLIENVAVIQLFAGVVNVFLKAPVWMQVVHLLLADLLWVGFVLFATEVLGAPDRAGRSTHLSSKEAAAA
jgi:heme A synthase